MTAAAIYLAAALAGLHFAGWVPGYPLDDTYIHLAMARTLAATGVWGTDPDFPAAASSAPLWTALLAGIMRLWPTAWREAALWIPHGLNLAAGLATVLLWTRILRGSAHRLLAVCVLIAVVPLGAIGQLGMEHVLHLLLATLLAWRGAVTLADPRPASRDLVLLGLLAMLAVGARYESAFLVAALAALALLRRQPILACAILGGGLVPVIGFGLWWMQAGGWLLPNPLLLKRSDFFATSGWQQLVLQPLLTLWHNLRIPILREQLLIALVLLPFLSRAAVGRAGTAWRAEAVLGWTAWLTTILHLAFGAVGWLHRYEAWIVALAGIAILALLPAAAPGRLARAGLAILLLLGLGRGLIATYQTVASVDDRRLEHLLPAAFVRSAYPGATVMVNDLGAMAYFGGARTIDLFGLGHNEPIRLRRQPQGYDRASLAAWAKRAGVSIAVLQPCWKEVFPRIPADWQLVATWTVPRNLAFTDRVVGFFAVDPAQADRLRAALDAFPLPGNVQKRLAPTPAFAAFMAAEDRIPERESLGCPARIIP